MVINTKSGHKTRAFVKMCFYSFFLQKIFTCRSTIKLFVLILELFQLCLQKLGFFLYFAASVLTSMICF